jgi:signal transduction histidine kinase
MELGSLAAELPPVPKRIKTRLRALQRGVVEAAETSRHVAYQLHPSELDDLGLVTALRAYCEDFDPRRNQRQVH